MAHRRVPTERSQRRKNKVAQGAFLEAPVDLPTEVATVVITAARLPQMGGEAAFSLIRLETGELVEAQRRLASQQG